VGSWPKCVKPKKEKIREKAVTQENVGVTWLIRSIYSREGGGDELPDGTNILTNLGLDPGGKGGKVWGVGKSLAKHGPCIQSYFGVLFLTAEQPFSSKS